MAQLFYGMVVKMLINGRHGSIHAVNKKCSGSFASRLPQVLMPPKKAAAKKKESKNPENGGEMVTP